MEVDEKGTLSALKRHRQELLDDKIALHHGRTIKLMGDGMLVEFRTVEEAVLCAIEIQREMGRRNSNVRSDQQIEFRIGINIGDILFGNEDVYGDGVNLAAHRKHRSSRRHRGLGIGARHRGQSPGHRFRRRWRACIEKH
ncbi:adenylate/guanylate cyclase domain-containing protein [Rhizobium sp. LjRoot258]